MSTRWLLANAMPGAEGIWHSVTMMTATKQTRFFDRILFLHGIALRKRGTKSSSPRLSLATWEREAAVLRFFMSTCFLRLLRITHFH